MPDAEVSITPDVTGSSTAVGSQAVLWMVTEIDGLPSNTHVYSPQGVSFPNFRTGLNRKEDGSWCKEKGYLGGAKDNGVGFTIYVVGASESADQYFRQYLETSAAINSFSGFRYFPAGVTTYTSVHVTQGIRLSPEKQASIEQQQSATCPRQS
jgi:hypothetical protein